MSSIATTKMSSRGQVVIPEVVRHKLGFETGTRFIVSGEGDVIVLKRLNPPSMDEFDAIVARARKQARTTGLRETHVRTAIRKVRRRK